MLRSSVDIGKRGMRSIDAVYENAVRISGVILRKAKPLSSISLRKLDRQKGERPPAVAALKTDDVSMNEPAIAAATARPLSIANDEPQAADFSLPRRLLRLTAARRPK